MVTSVVSPARRVSNHPVASGLARFGLAARACVYLLIAWLALEIAIGRGNQQANQRGALADVARHAYGIVVLWVLAIGFAIFALWKAVEVVTGSPVEGRGAGARLRAALTAVTWAALCVTAFALIAGRSTEGQAQQQAGLTGRLMRHTDGRWLVGAVGVIVAAVGLLMVVEGARRRFEKSLRMGEMHGSTRRLVVAVGTVGSVARGAVVTLTGALVVDAAVTVDPAKSTGLDGALRTLAHRAYGPELLGVVAAGLLAFALYAFAEARWAETSH